MRKVLVTGAGGFIGSHLTEELVRRGYQVRAFIRYNSRNFWGWLEESDYLDHVEVIVGDIRDFDSVFDAMQGTDTVFHLAALIGIPYSYISPLAYIRTNVEGTYNVLQAARMHQLENVLVTSTSETYGTAQYVPIDEKHPLVGQSPYSASKIGADQLAISFHRSFGLPVKIVRPFNTYGPRQSARAIIPTIAIQLLSGNKKIAVGNLHPTRDLTFVEDTVAGFLAIAREKSLIGQVTNIGTNSEISIGDLVNKLIGIVGTEAEIIIEEKRVRPNDSEVERLLCDNRKLLEHTDWRPRTALDEGLQKTVDWLKDHLDMYKASIYNV